MMLPKDPAMLLGTVNMKLRDSYSSWEALCEDMGVSPEEKKRMEEKLAGIDYRYDAKRNQFV